MLEIGTKAPDFTLPAATARRPVRATARNCDNRSRWSLAGNSRPGAYP